MTSVKDLRKLKVGQAYNFRRLPGSTQAYGIVGKVKPDMDHPQWGTVYDNLGHYLVAASYGEWLEAEEVKE
jgi:hypothetical protein